MPSSGCSRPGYRVGALAALVRPDGRLLLVDQPYVEGWNLPGGDLERGEQPGPGLARELREELGIVVEVGALTQATLRTHDRWVTFATRVDVTDEVADRVARAQPRAARVGWFAPDGLPPLHGDAVGPLALLGLVPRRSAEAVSAAEQARQRPNTAKCPTSTEKPRSAAEPLAPPGEQLRVDLLDAAAVAADQVHVVVVGRDRVGRARRARGGCAGPCRSPRAARGCGRRSRC